MWKYCTLWNNNNFNLHFKNVNQFLKTHHHHQFIAVHCWTCVSLSSNNLFRFSVIRIQHSPVTFHRSSIQRARSHLTLSLPTQSQLVYTNENRYKNLLLRILSRSAYRLLSILTHTLSSLTGQSHDRFQSTMSTLWPESSYAFRNLLTKIVF